MTDGIALTDALPAAPTTAAEAATRLTEAKSNPAWRDGLMAGNSKELGEFKSWHALINQGDSHDLAIAGQFAPGEIQTSSHMQDMGVANSLQEAGIGPDVIKQVLANGSVSAEEFAKAKQAKAMLMSNKEFQQKLIAKDGETFRTWKHLNIILSSEVVG